MSSTIVERVRRVADLHASLAMRASHEAGVLEAALRDMAAIASWMTAMEADIVRELAAVSTFPEAVIAGVSRGSMGAASKVRERADTLDEAPSFADALARGSIVPGHVDELTKASKKLDDADQRDALFGRTESLLAEAESSTVARFAKVLSREVASIQRDDGMARLERQRRATTMSSWVDDDGMWNVRAKFDPFTGVRLSAQLDAALATLLAEAVPESCPTDPVEKQKHLRALALARLIESGLETTGRSAKPEFVAVIDCDQPNGAGGPMVDWGLDVQLPMAVIAELIGSGAADLTAVVVRNGVVLHAPGLLDQGRGARHANRAQRRALRGLYAACAMPGCRTHFDRCKLHHIVWWSKGGSTNLANLLPVCVHHHHKIHDDGWEVSLDGCRRLTVTLPDGTVMSTGPPSRLAG